MMEKFTASNGVEILESGFDHEERPVMSLMCHEREDVIMSERQFPAHHWDALREFFRHERDEELGRWRSSIHPSWTAVEDRRVYRFTNDDGKRGFHVHKEDRSYRGWVDELREVAKEFLDAHPVSRPWHDAKPGEVWVLSTNNGKTHGGIVGADRYLRSIDSDGDEMQIDLGDKWITAGRRIFPEASDD